MAFCNEGSSPFAITLKYWCDVRGYSNDRLDALIGCEPGEVHRLESGSAVPSAALAARVDEVLQAGGAVIASFAEGSPVSDQQRWTAGNATPESAGILVRRDHTSLDFDGVTYRVRHSRHIVNTGRQPLPSYTVRISVDRYPGSAERSRQHHRMHALNMMGLGFVATCDSQPLTWDLIHDANAYKEIRLHLADQAGNALIGPGDGATIKFEYKVSAQAWGKWLQRVVRHPTLALSITMSFPAHLQMKAWGHQIVGTAAALPIKALEHQRHSHVDSYSWSTTSPEVDSVFRFEWRSLPKVTDHEGDEYATPMTARQTMQAAGIVQSDNPLLGEKSSAFDLPAEAEQCREVLNLISLALDRLARVHRFGKGQGIAAVQIGIPRAAATIRLDDGPDINLINPRIISESPDADVQFEGCLSFFDVRGRVARPRRLEVEYQDLIGNRIVQVFRDGAARLVAHEVDHINGILYTDRMPDGEPLIPLSKYSGIGKDWSYPNSDA